jgi:hypothetical protein
MNDEELSRRLEGLPRPDLRPELTETLKRRAQARFAGGAPIARLRAGRTNMWEPGLVLAFAFVYLVWAAAAIAPLCKPNLGRAEHYGVAAPK